MNSSDSNNKQSFLSEDLHKVKTAILENNYKKIVVQVDKPSTLIAMKFITELKKHLKCDNELEIIILSDSLKNTCCDDNILVDRISGEILIKIGNSCGTKSFGQCKVNETFHVNIITEYEITEVSDFLASEVFAKAPNNYYVLLDNEFRHSQKRLEESLLKSGVVDTQFIFIDQKKTSEESLYLAFNFYADRLFKDEARGLIFLSNNEDSSLVKGLVNQNDIDLQKIVYLKLDGSLTLKTISVTTELSKRMNLMMKVPESEIFGLLLVNSLIDNANDILGDLIQVLKAHNKKYFIFSLNSLNEFKLANFANIQVWVQISCSWSLVRDYKEFYKNVLTPDELIQAFDLDNWNGKLNNDIQHWAPKNYPEVTNNEKKDSESEIVEEKTNNPHDHKDSRAIVVKKQNLQLSTVKELYATHDFFINSTFKGLDRSIKTQTSKAKPGREGIASVYTTEIK